MLPGVTKRAQQKSVKLHSRSASKASFCARVTGRQKHVTMQPAMSSKHPHSPVVKSAIYDVDCSLLSWFMSILPQIHSRRHKKHPGFSLPAMSTKAGDIFTAGKIEKFRGFFATPASHVRVLLIQYMKGRSLSVVQTPLPIIPDLQDTNLSRNQHSWCVLPRDVSDGTCTRCSSILCIMDGHKVLLSFTIHFSSYTCDVNW